MTPGRRSDKSDGHDHWDNHARNWSHFGSPLRPSAEDVAAFEQAILEAEPDRQSLLQAVLLGVTPELAGCRWPSGTSLLAIDHSPAMIRALWPAPGVPADARAVCGDWSAIPLAKNKADIVVGDGCFGALAFSDQARNLSREVGRVLRLGGLFAIRVFLRPDRAETVDDIARDLAAGRIGSVHAMKWRIAAAIHGSTRDGVRLADIWDVWSGLLSAAEKLGSRRPGGQPGWRPAELATLDAYRNVQTRYCFPTIADFRAIVAEDFDERRCVFGSYELGDRCPVFVLVKRSS